MGPADRVNWSSSWSRFDTVEVHKDEDGLVGKVNLAIRAALSNEGKRVKADVFPPTTNPEVGSAATTQNEWETAYPRRGALNHTLI